MRKNRIALLLSVGTFALASGVVSAAGFQLQNQNGAGTGYAYAGAAAVAEDASTIFFNPAGLTYLSEGHHLSGAVTLLSRSLEFKNEGSNSLVTLPGPVVWPLGGDGGQAGGLSVVPAAYWAMSINDRLRVGLGISPTFGNATEWDDDFIGRYQGSYSEIKAINFNPSAAYRVSDAVSLGFGLNIVHFEADLRGKVPTALGDRESKLTGEDTGYGYNLGAMFQLSPATRLGLTYRSSIELTVTGKSETPLGSTPAKVKIELPDSASIALSHRIGPKLELLADYTWTGWSKIQSLRVTNRNTGALLTDELLGFKDSYRIGIGAQYQYSDSLRLRAGVAYDQSPVRSASDRTVRLPDADRTWLALGFNYKFSPSTSVDVGYSHLFFDDSDIDRRTTIGTIDTTQFVRGSFDTAVDIFSVQLNHHF